MNAQIARLFGVDRGAVRAADRVHLALDRVRQDEPRQQPAQQPHADPGAEDQARPDPGRRRDGAGEVGAGARAAPGTGPTRPGPLFAQAVGYSNLAQGQAAGLELSDGQYAARAADRAELGLRPAHPEPGRRRRLHDARPQGPAGGSPGSSPARPGRSSRSTRRPARSRSCTRTRATTTTTRTNAPGTTHRSTARPRPVIRPARRSRS